MKKFFLNPIGLSVVDLFTCAFTALFVLNLLSEQSTIAVGRKESGLDFVSVELDEAHRTYSYSIAIEVVLGGKSFSSWTHSGGTIWIASPGIITVSNFPMPIKSPFTVHIALRELPAVKIIKEFSAQEDTLRCYVKSSVSKEVTSGSLGKSNFWRTSLTIE